MRSQLQSNAHTVIEPPVEDQATFSPAKLRFAALAVIVIAGIIRAWIGRYSMNPDGICYLDLGDAFTHRRWLETVNGYWSPFYTWLLGAALFITKPSRWREFPVAHAVNFIIYLATFFCFEFFLRSLHKDTCSQPTNDEDANTMCLTDRSRLILSYAIFLWTSLELITLWDLSPDMCVAAFVYLMAGLLLLIRRRGSLLLSITLGIVLGLAYLTKAIMFPLGFAFVLIGLAGLPRGKRLGYLLPVTLSFLAVCAPWLAALSHVKGRFDFGDSGRLAYSSLVSPGGRILNWQGEPPASGVPVHPTRKIHENPPVYEFASPVGGTYPPSYDPSYWDEGRKWTFDAKMQAKVIEQGLFTYAELLLRGQSGLLAAALTLVLVGGVATRKAILKNWPLFAICFVATGLYLLVLVEWRYVAAYVSIFWMTIFFGVRLSSPEQRKMAEYLVIGVAITILLSVADGTVRAGRAGGPYSAADQVAVADGLEKMGLKAGDRVAVIGDGNWSYWARSGKLKIVSNLMSPDAPAFWAEQPEQREEVYKLFALTGARAIVTMKPSAVDAREGWQQIGHSEYYVRWHSQ